AIGSLRAEIDMAQEGPRRLVFVLLEFLAATFRRALDEEPGACLDLAREAEATEDQLVAELRLVSGRRRPRPGEHHQHDSRQAHDRPRLHGRVLTESRRRRTAGW